MTSKNTTGRMVLEVNRPLLEVLHHLSFHSSDIHSHWLKLLKRYNLCGKHAHTLAGLHLSAQAQNLRSANQQAYREKYESQGHDLARRGVPAECAAVAVALYVESCL